MIISGFPGIGKSTLVRYGKNLDRIYIDLESSTFHTGSLPKDWAEYYIRTAINLHEQGFCVFVSCHDDVREKLLDRINDKSIEKNQVAVMFPSIDIIDKWDCMLKVRASETGSTKDKLAYEFFKFKGRESISKLEESTDFHKIIMPNTPNKYGSYNYLDWLISDNIKILAKEVFM